MHDFNTSKNLNPKPRKFLRYFCRRNFPQTVSFSFFSWNTVYDMAEKQAVRLNEVEPPVRRKCRRATCPEMALTVVLNKKYVYLGDDDVLKARVFLKSSEEEQVGVNGDLSVYIVNNEGSELRIPRQFWLRSGAAELFIPLVGKHMGGFVLGRWFSIMVTMVSSPSWGLGLDMKRGIKGTATSESGDGVPGELLRGGSEALIQCDGKILVTKEPKDVYYKDEGGKKNAMEMEVLVLHRKRTGGEVPLPYAPLAMKLVYSEFSLEEVPDQSILRVLSGCRMLTGSDGTLKLQFRVSQVTKRHKGRKFKVCVEQAYNQLGSESVVALLPAYSSPFSVLSKRRRINRGHVEGGCHISLTDPTECTGAVSRLQDGHSLETMPPEPPSIPLPTLDYCLMLQSAYVLIDQLQWHTVGSLTSTKNDVKQVVPSFRCPLCGVSRDHNVPTNCVHDVRCEVGRWLQMYERTVLKGKQRALGVAGSHVLPAGEDHQPVNFNRPQKTADLIGGCEQNDDFNGRDEANCEVGLNSQPFPCDIIVGGEHSHEDQHPLKEESVYLNDLPIETDLNSKYSLYKWSTAV